MTKEEKLLLLKDLSSRLPYGVKVNISASRPDRYDHFVKSINDATINSIDLNIEKCKFKEFWWDSYIVNVRPYLRPMSSMTEEEYEELEEISPYYGFAPFKHIDDWCPNYDVVDWLNKHHFDYRGLIEQGLAIEALEGMYEVQD